MHKRSVAQSFLDGVGSLVDISPVTTNTSFFTDDREALLDDFVNIGKDIRSSISHSYEWQQEKAKKHGC